MLAGFQKRKFRHAVMQKHHVVIATRARRAAPFGAGKCNKAAFFVDRPHQGDGFVPLLFGDVEVIVRKRQHVETRYVAAIGEIVSGAVGADGVFGMHVQVGVVNTRHGQRVIDGNKKSLRFDGRVFDELRGDHQLAAGAGRYIVKQCHRPSLLRQHQLLFINRLAIQRCSDRKFLGAIPTGIAPLVFRTHA